MTIKFTRRRIVACAAVFAVAVLVPIALHAASTPATLEACVNPGNGMMRLVDSSTACHSNETRVTWNVEGPQGPPGEPGPPGPSAGGPPYVWVCTPAHLANGGGSNRSHLYVFNGSGTTANVGVNFLDISGTNLVGVTIPGSAPPEVYPGETGASTVPLSSHATRHLNWFMPNGSPDPAPNVAFTIRVTSDQPIVVGANLLGGGFMPNECNLLPK
jgi:hypothetical protein